MGGTDMLILHTTTTSFLNGAWWVKIVHIPQIELDMTIKKGQNFSSPSKGGENRHLQGFKRGAFPTHVKPPGTPRAGAFIEVL